MNFMNLGPMEMVIIAIIALVVVGPKKLPELGRMVGKWMKVVREASDEMRRGLYYEDDYRRPTPRLTAASKPDNKPAQEDKPPETVNPPSPSTPESSPSEEKSASSATEETSPTNGDSKPPEEEPGTLKSAEYKNAYPYDQDGMD